MQRRAHSPNLPARVQKGSKHHLFEERFFFGDKRKEKKRGTGWCFTLRLMNEKTLAHKRQASQGRKRKVALTHLNHLQCVSGNERDSPAPSMPHHSEAPSSSQHKNASHERRGKDSWQNNQTTCNLLSNQSVCVCLARVFKDLHQGSTNKHQVCVFEDRRNEKEKKNAAHSCDCDDITLLSCVGRAGVG